MVFFFPPLVMIVVTVFVGAWYREKLRKKYNYDVGKKDSLSIIDLRANNFDSGLFDCFNGRKAVKKCCFACCCPPVRWSANASATGVMEFWIALILSSLFITIMFLFGFIARIHMRASYGMEKHPISDFCSWLCCYSCALTQEAKFVDNGFRALRDGRQRLQIESQEPPAASVVSKQRPETPATEPPMSPPTARGSGTEAR